MATKTVSETLVTRIAADARYMIDVSDEKDDGPGDNPRCAYAVVELRDGENQMVWLQQVTRDAGGVVTGRTPIGVLTGPELVTLRGLLGKIFNKAATDAGYTL